MKQGHLSQENTKKDNRVMLEIYKRKVEDKGVKIIAENREREKERNKEGE